MTTALLEDTTRDAVWSGPVIDCDVHANVPSLEALDRYLDPRLGRGREGTRLARPGRAAAELPARRADDGARRMAAGSADAGLRPRDCCRRTSSIPGASSARC